MTRKTGFTWIGAALVISLAGNGLWLYKTFFAETLPPEAPPLCSPPAAEPVKEEAAKPSGAFTPGALPIQLFSTRHASGTLELDFLSTGSFVPGTIGFRIDPEAANCRSEYGGNRINLVGDFLPGVKYRVTVNAGLKNSAGGVLEKNAVAEITIPDLAPEAAFLTDGEYLALSSESITLPYRTRNCPSVTLRLAKAYRNNLNPFYHMEWRADQSMETVAERVIPLNTPRNEAVCHQIDLAELLDGRTPGAYKIELDAPGLEEIATRRFILTDLALLAVNDDGAGRLQVFCRSLEKNRPVAGAAVTLLSAKNQVLATGETGADGGALLTYTPARNRKSDSPVAVMAEKGDDFSYFRLKDARNPIHSGRFEDADEPRAFVFAERGVCRPGESFTASVFLRQPENGSFAPMKKVPATLTVTDPNSRKFSDLRLMTDEYGFARAEIPVPAAAMTGEYRISVFAAGGSRACGVSAIRVAAYVPDRIKVTGLCRTAAVNLSSALDFEFGARYYFGAPLEIGSYQYTVDALVGRPPAHWDPSWSSGAPELFNAGGEWSGKGAKTQDSIAIAYPGFVKLGGRSYDPVLIRARAEVQEPGGRGVTGCKSVTLYPTEYFIGLRSADSGSRKKAVEWTLLPVEKDQVIKPADSEITFELLRKEWEYLLTTDSRGNYRRQWEQRRIPLPDRKQTQSLAATGGKVEWELPAGEYELTARIGEAYLSRLSFHHYTGEGGGRSGDPRLLAFRTDAESYPPGGTAVFTFDSPGDGEAFLSLGEKSLDACRVIPVRMGKNEVSVAIPGGLHTSAYYAGVTLVTRAKGEYLRNFGLLKLNVDQTKAHRLTVRLDLPESAEPEAEIPVTVSLADAAGRPRAGLVALYLVDSGVISLTDYQVPDIFSRFYGASPCPFECFDLYGLLFERLKITPEGRIGGDVAGKFGALKQKETARVILPAVTVPASGSATVLCRLPDHVGAMEAFAVASSDEAAGSAARNLILRNKVTVTVSAPRYLVPGDAAELSFTLFNHDAESSEYACTVTLPEGLKAGTHTFRGNDLPRGSQKNLTLAVRAGEVFGAGLVKASLQVGEEAAKTDTWINIRAANVEQTDHSLVLLQPGETAEFKLQEGYIGTPKGTLRLAASPALGVTAALGWLNGYPYGCLEQTAAAAFPFTALPALVKAGLVSAEVAETARHKIAGGYANILQMSLSDGSFAMWPGGSEPWSDGSLFALHFVFEAIRRNQLSIDDAARAKYLKYLRRIADDADPANRNRRAYAVYVLAVAGDNAFATAARNLVSSSGKADYALFLAGAALVKGGYAGLGMRPLAAALEADCHREANAPLPCSDDACRLGMTLHILMDSGAGSDALATRLALELAKQIRKDGSAWGTTQANAWASLGLAAYADRFPPQPARAKVNDEEKTVAKVEETRLAGNTTVANLSGGLLIAESRVTGIPRQAPPDGGKLKVSKAYLDRSGNPVTSVSHGDEVFVRIRFEAPFAVESVVIADLLPAGLEIEDENLATRSATLPRNLSNRYGALHPKRLEKRDDRFLLFGDAEAGPAEFTYRTRAVIRGDFAVPPLHAEAIVPAGRPGRYERHPPDRGEMKRLRKLAVSASLCAPFAGSPRGRPGLVDRARLRAGSSRGTPGADAGARPARPPRQADPAGAHLGSRVALPVELAEISPEAVKALLAAEDAGFYRHSGVDYGAVCRAAWQNLTSGKVVSGASTISMQLAGMTLPPGRKSLRAKLKQAVRARRLEQCHSKTEILAEYLNRIPFGGKLHGIEAAAQYYFGLPAAKINLAEASLLCGLPQKPNRFRPDRHFAAAKERQRLVLRLLAKHGLITGEEAERLHREEPLRLRDFRYPAAFELGIGEAEWSHALRHIPSYQAETSLDFELQSTILELLKTRRSRLDGVRDAAAVLLDNRTGEVLAYIGTLDFRNPENGQVDAARAIRSAGSALKPFLYAEAIDAGWIVAATRLNDAPLAYADYRPGNYDGQFHGTVSAAHALSHSLNTPAIRLAARLGTGRVLDCFDRLQLRSDQKRDTNPGLSLALGTVGHTLFDLTRAYGVLANDGVLVEATFVPALERIAVREEIFLPGSCRMISRMLRERPLPGSAREVAWKTGTSANNCDAWCFAYTPDYTLGVWFGNKSGKPSPALVGVEAAAPAAGEIFDLLYRNRPAPVWPGTEAFELRDLCAESGLTPGSFCGRRAKEYAVPGLPLTGCRSCGGGKAAEPVRILSPLPIQYQPPPGHNGGVTLSLRSNRPSVYWFLNGRFIGRDLAHYVFPTPGDYTLRAVAAANASAAEVKFTLR